MKRIIIIGICLSIITNLFGNGNVVDSLSVYNKIEKENVHQIEFETLISHDSIIEIYNDIKTSINGICVTGNGILYSDSSLIRIIAVDISGNEYLMFESTVLSDDIGKVEFHNRSDETFWLEPFCPQKMIIQLVDAKVEIEKIVSYNSIEKDKQKRSNLQKVLEKEISDCKFNKVKAYIKKNKMVWAAENRSLSNCYYSTMKKLYGDKYNSYGFEYYRDGFFSLPNSFSLPKTNLKSVSTTYVSEFDWRNRHGQNWMTPNKCQSGCWLNNQINCDYSDATSCTNAGGEFRDVGTCWAFAAVGALEALTNLYFNQHINYDLSEQNIVSCSYKFAKPWHLDSTLDFIQNNYVVPETCYPYEAANGSCNNTCVNPNDRISFPSYSEIYSENDLKMHIIQNGPMPCKMALWSHVLVYVGFGTVKIGDYIDFVGGNTIQSGDPNIGKTYWILKQSNTNTGWPYHTGYIYMLNKPDYSYIINMPISSQVYSSNNIVCSDNDHDGYFWWGIGSKPASCPICAPSTPDGDDSNPNLGPMDAYGNCTPITIPYTSPEHQITVTETWQNTSTECGNVIVKNSGNLTISNATINLEGNATFSVEVGGTLTITSGTIQ